jgi:hypothetical protein
MSMRLDLMWGPLPPPEARGARPRHGRRAEAGSAYVVALLVLVVLTIIGLALTLVTQSEVQIGAYERTTNRSFYATDSGISIATSATLWQSNDKNLRFMLNTTQQDTGTTPATTFADEITVMPMSQIHWQNCNLCQINIDQPYKFVVHMAQSSTDRIGIDPSNNAVPITAKYLSTMVGIQPWTPDVNKELSSAAKSAFNSIKW